jgi:hypothetical protein
MIWLLQSKFELPAGSGPWFWTINQDYTRDISKAHQFKEWCDADRWLRTHKHLITSLCVVSVDHSENSNGKS